MHRVIVFFVVSAVILLGEILATLISAFLMSPWLPLILSVVSEGIELLAAIVVPKTKDYYGLRYQALLTNDGEDGVNNKSQEADDPKIG